MEFYSTSNHTKVVKNNKSDSLTSSQTEIQRKNAQTNENKPLQLLLGNSKVNPGGKIMNDFRTSKNLHLGDRLPFA